MDLEAIKWLVMNLGGLGVAVLFLYLYLRDFRRENREDMAVLDKRLDRSLEFLRVLEERTAAPEPIELEQAQRIRRQRARTPALGNPVRRVPFDTTPDKKKE